MKKNTLKSIVSIAMLTVLGVVNVQAQDQDRKQKPPTVDEIFEQMDANEDGLLSEKEIEGPLKDNFAKIDTNEDGYISKEELEEAPKPKGRRPSRD
ncbi:EF-hand domain-containing protein [Joostella sp.]|uniref:EF-hand domain-containing protein n=1 Tax=Joostella sp. TaxID=2231138 RepID=UPI003A8DB877